MTNNIFHHPQLFVYTSQRVDGSMKNNGVFNTQNIANFLQKNSITKYLILMNQVHGTSIHHSKVVETEPIVASDGVITQNPGLVLGVVTADCLPIVFFNTESKVIAAIHAGYRGLYDGIIGETLNQFEQYAQGRSEILVGIGPSIGVCCYNVNQERSDMFAERFGKEFIEQREDKHYLDLKKIAMLELVTHGIPQDNISVSSICTQSSVDQYFSYRGDSDDTFGELITVIGLT